MSGASGKTALVTGASSGIGEELALGLGARGFDLLLVARSESRLSDLGSEISKSHGVICEVLAADLSESAEVRKVADQIRRAEITTVVNNAGFGSYGRFVDLPVENEIDEVRLNVEALVALSHAALEVSVPRHSGGLLNVASTASFQPVPKNATYSATKAFVLAFTEALHEEVLSSGVHVTALCPGLTHTGFQARAGMTVGRAPGFMWSDASGVAAAGLDALERNQAVCVVGLANRFGSAAVRFGPRSVVRKMAGKTLNNM